MTAQVVTLAPETTLGDVAQLMVERDVRALPVVDESGTLLGMVTHKELLKFLIPDYLQRTKSGEVRALTKSQIQRGSTRSPAHSRYGKPWHARSCAWRKIKRLAT